MNRINRSLVELKRETETITANFAPGINRSLVELKLDLA